MLTQTSSAETIYTVARQLNTSLDLDEVLGKVLRLTVEATDATRGSLFLLDEAGCVTRQILARPHLPPEISRRNIDLVMEQGLGGWVYRNKAATLVTDTTHDERWFQLPDSDDLTGSALVSPLLYQGNINGLLMLHHQQFNFFNQDHLVLVDGIANQAAIAIENARLFTQIKSEREGFYSLINAMPIPMLLIDADDVITFSNRAAQEQLRLNQVNVPLTTIAGGEQLKQALTKLETQEDNRIEVNWPDDQVFNVSINQVHQAGTVVALDDITYLKELDDMKTQFVETVSHDLRNPLSVIVGFVQLLQFDPNLSSMAKKAINGIVEGTEQMQSLIDDLLDLARIEAGIVGEVEECNLMWITKEVLDSFEHHLVKKELTLSTELPPYLPKILADEMRLSQVITNLVSNAIKYTPQQGQIEVKLSHKDDMVVFQVSDNGPGISLAGQAQLFQKFYRVPEIQSAMHVSGTGLGLSIVKAIVEGYGGRVWVKSQVGVGSTFGCSLPVAPVTVEALSPA